MMMNQHDTMMAEFDDKLNRLARTFRQALNNLSKATVNDCLRVESADRDVAHLLAAPRRRALIKIG
jgi:hypothetical protein